MESINNIPQEVIEYVMGIMGSYENADNIRICEETNTLAKTTQDYEDCRSHGCCGSVDYQLFRYNGKNYIYGFNFGH